MISSDNSDRRWLVAETAHPNFDICQLLADASSPSIHLEFGVSSSLSMFELNGIRCWIEDGETNEPFPEYGTKVKGRTITAFIESKVGRPFTVNCYCDREKIPQQGFRLYLGETEEKFLAFDALIEPSYGERILGRSLPDEKVQPFQFQSKTIEGTRLSFQFLVYNG